ncbi:MAG: hypothetical protein R3C44_04360 [Chloroflexota bacterium]
MPDSGHRSASNAIRDAIREIYGDELDVIVANRLTSPLYHRFSGRQADHTRLVRSCPRCILPACVSRIQSWSKVSERWPGNSCLARRLTAFWIATNRRVVVKLIHQHRTVAELPSNQCGYLPIITIVTDLTRLHRLWFDEDVDLCLLPTRAAVGLANGAWCTRRSSSGYRNPRPSPVQQTNRYKSRTSPDIWPDPDLFTVLAVGSKRMELTSTCNKSATRPLQVIAVAGVMMCSTRQSEQMA